MKTTSLVCTFILGVSSVLCVGSAEASPASAHARHAPRPTPRIEVTASKILLGSHERFHGIGTLDRRAVFNAIPAVKTIRKEKLSRNSARYQFLLAEANKSFRRALTRISQEKGIDLVVDKGGVSAAGLRIHDLTEVLTEALK